MTPPARSTMHRRRRNAFAVVIAALTAVLAAVASIRLLAQLAALTH